MLGTYIAVVKTPGFINCQLDNFLGPGRQPNLAGIRPAAATHYEFNRRPDFAYGYPQVGKNLAGDTVFFCNKAEQYMLGINIIMTEVLRLFLGTSECPACTLRKFLKSTSHSNLEKV